MQIQDYQAPNGAVDFPFIYAYDASALTDGATVQNIQLLLQGDCDFVLRAIRGLPTCLNTGQNGGRFGYRNNSQSYTNSNPSTGIVPGVNEPVLPEKIYPAGGTSIMFDLYNVLRSFTACGQTPIYNSQIAFCGVKRFPAGSIYSQAIQSRPFKRKAQTYSYALTVDWSHFTASGAIASRHQFSILNSNFDFELLGIRISQPGATHPLLTNDFNILLYDRHQYATASIPVNQGYINSARATPQTAPPYRAAFPCPPLIYPANSQIFFEIVSMLCSTSVPQSYTIDFVGCWRLPT